MANGGPEIIPYVSPVQREKLSGFRQYLTTYEDPEARKIVIEYLQFRPYRSISDKFRVGQYEDRGWILIHLKPISSRKPELDEVIRFVDTYKGQKGMPGFEEVHDNDEIHIAYRELQNEHWARAHRVLKMIQKLRTSDSSSSDSGIS